MKILGALVRYVLNINTIWGLMILTAVVLCAAQHYLPTTTVIPVDRLKSGPHSVTIRVADKDDKVSAFDFTVTSDASSLLIARSDRDRRPGQPWLVSAKRVGEAYLLKWDFDGYGTYELAVDGKVVGSGKLVTFQSLTDAAFDYAEIGFDIALGLVASMVLFLGLMKVGEAAGIVQLVAKGLYPVIRFLFPDVPKDHPASGAILMNWTTTLLGLGNAATPFGLKAMQELQDLNPNKDVASDSQVMLLGYNTAGLALLPTTLLAVRKSAGCSDPFEIIGTCMLAGAVATAVAIVMVKVLGKLPFFSLRAALAEEAAEESADIGPADPAGEERP